MGPSSIDSLQTYAHPPPLAPFALLRFVRRAAVAEIQSVEEREKVRPGGQNRLLFKRENTLFSVLRTADCGADTHAGGEAALSPGPPPTPHPAAGGKGGPPPRTPPPRHPTPPPGGRGKGGPPPWTPSPRHAVAPPPPHSASPQPVGRRPRASPLAVKLAFGPTPSRCAARRKYLSSRFSSFRNDLDHCNTDVHFGGRALRRSRIWMYLIRACRQVLRMRVIRLR